MLPAVPESYCIDLDLATPTWLPDAVPLVTVASSNKPKVLYAVVSPLTEPMSGVLYRFVIFVKLPISKVVTPALIVLKSLALFKSLNVFVIFSISKPLTYALPGEHASASKESDAVFSSLVVAPVVYTPANLSFWTVCVVPSLTSNWKGLTV